MWRTAETLLSCNADNAAFRWRRDDQVSTALCHIIPISIGSAQAREQVPPLPRDKTGDSSLGDNLQANASGAPGKLANTILAVPRKVADGAAAFVEVRNHQKTQTRCNGYSSDPEVLHNLKSGKGGPTTILPQKTTV